MSQTIMPQAKALPPAATSRKTLILFDASLIWPAMGDAVMKLGPRTQARSPVMFVVYVGSILTTLMYFRSLSNAEQTGSGFILAISVWLWFTVLFANFAEALAEGRSKAQAASLRGLKQTVMAKTLATPKYGTTWLPMPGADLRKGHIILVEAGDVIPASATAPITRLTSAAKPTAVFNLNARPTSSVELSALLAESARKKNTSP